MRAELAVPAMTHVKHAPTKPPPTVLSAQSDGTSSLIPTSAATTALQSYQNRGEIAWRKTPPSVYPSTI